MNKKEKKKEKMKKKEKEKKKKKKKKEKRKKRKQEGKKRLRIEFLEEVVQRSCRGIAWFCTDCPKKTHNKLTLHQIPHSIGSRGLSASGPQ